MENTQLKLRAAVSAHGHPAGHGAHTELTQSSHGAHRCHTAAPKCLSVLFPLHSAEWISVPAEISITVQTPISSWEATALLAPRRHIPPRTNEGLFQRLWTPKKGIVLGVLLLAFLSSGVLFGFTPPQSPTVYSIPLLTQMMPGPKDVGPVISLPFHKCRTHS